MSSPVGAALADLGAVLGALGLPWYLFGAQAAILYGSTRVTEDIDVTVALGAHTPAELVNALRAQRFELRVPGTHRFVERTRVLPVAHVATGLPIDIVLAGAGLEDLFFSRARLSEREGIAVPVASAEDIIVMKILAGRPRDLEDIRAMLSALGPKLRRSTIESTLEMLEDALGQSDLRPLFHTLSKKLPVRAAARRASERSKNRPDSAAARTRATPQRRRPRKK